MRRLRLDPFLLAIVGAAVLATFLPVRGAGVEVFGVATLVAIFCLFYLYGARLHPREALAGLKHWRLHLIILVFTFVLFPVVGLLLGFIPDGLLAASLYPGLLYVTLCPSTVQSSVNFTSIAKGNVAGAIVSASTSNLLGVFLTPLLAIALLNTTGNAAIGFGSIADIGVQILLPFVLGQLTQRWTGAFITRHKKLKLFDQAVIVLVVYAAFSAGVREGIWQLVGVGDIVSLVVVCLVVLAGMLTLTWFSAKRLGFSPADCITIQMCGTKKSLATGLPMATVLFAGQPIGLLLLPLIIFHQAQLMACSALASRYRNQSTDSA